MSTATNAAVERPAPGGRVLLVDDEENILRSLKRVLRRGDWEIETARDGAEALEVFLRFRPHVVISDFRMPGMTGVELLARVKEQAPQVQRIMLTGHADQQAIEDAINRAEVFRFLTKPWNDAQLVSMVKSAFEQHGLLEENQRLFQLAHEKAEALESLNADLERRVLNRTQALARAKREWELTFDSIDSPLVVVRLDDLVVKRANVAAARVTGRAVTDVAQGPKCHAFVFGRAEPCPGCPVTKALAQPATAEVHLADRTWVLRAWPMEDGAIAVCNYHDVTEERAITRRLIESEKMIAIGNLAGGVAHEINNPLGGILAFSQLMKRDDGRTEQDVESLSLIEESALRCKRIVESLLKFSRRSKAEDRRTFDLSRCVEDAVVLFSAQAKKFPRLKVVPSLSGELPEVFGDPAQVAQVVLNLLQNGMHALPKTEGTITVTTGARDGHVYFSVSDTGTGIPADVLPRIFEPHFTTKPPGEGTGLGLAIGYRIIQDHGGHFEVKTEVGQGSTFTVVLPVTPGEGGT